MVGGLTASGEATPRVDLYDPATDSWSRVSDLPVPIHHTAVVEFGDRLWVVGGYTIEQGEWKPLARVWSLGAGDGGWREEPPLSTARGALAAMVVGDQIVAGGGVGEDGTVLASVEVFGGEIWSPGPDMTEPREHFAMAGTLAVAGRQGGLTTNLDGVEALAVEGGEWSSAGTLQRSRGGIGAAVVSGRVCVAGGEEPDGTLAEVECLSPEGSWEIVAHLVQPRHGLAVIALEGALHVVGGGPEPGLTVSDAHEVITIEA